MARQPGLTRGGVNGLIKGDTVPSESALKLLKLVLAFSASPSSGNTELESWRRRALDAEGELEKVRQALSPKLSSRKKKEGVGILARNFAGGIRATVRKTNI